MKRQVPEVILVGGVVALAAILHIFLRTNLVSLAPLPLVLSLWLIWMLPAPGYYVIILATIAELFSWLPPGIMASATLLPFAIRRLRKETEVDVSFTFAATILLTVALQNFVISSPLLFSLAFSDNAAAALLRLPWPTWLYGTAATSVAAILLCLGTQMIRPGSSRREAPHLHRRLL